MAKKPSSPFLSCLLPALTLSLGLACGLIVASQIIPNRVEDKFGAPTSGLSYRERITYSALLLWRGNELTKSHSSSEEEIIFFIEFGETVQSITGRLWEMNLIPNPGIFRTYLQYSGLDRAIQAGEHTIRENMTPVEIAQSLKDAIPTHVTFVVIPGWRIEEIADVLPTSGLTFSKEQFLSLANSLATEFAFSNNFPGNATMEGFLFPDTYRLPREINAREFILTMVNNFDLQISEEIRQGLERQGLDLFRGTTLASIVEREAILDEEKPLIASVFLNRISAGMPLASDPTVQYALGYNQDQNTWWTNPLTLEDLSIDSPYNTYIYTDLPPGPISNPGQTSIRAVAFPAQTPYLYFRAACDQSGRHLFSETYAEHLSNSCP